MSMECKYSNGRPTQSATEQIAYLVDCTNWTESPTGPVVDYVFDETSGSDVKATVMPSGSPSVTNAVLTLPLLQSLTVGRRYRVEFHLTGDNNNRLEAHIRVECTTVSTS